MLHLSDETLNQYLDLALAPDARESAGAHLADCPDCAARLDELRAALVSLDSLPDLVLDMDFSGAVVACLKKTTVLPRAVGWLTAAQFCGTLLALTLAWPLLAQIVPLPDLPSLPGAINALAAVWFKAVAELRLPPVNLEIPVSGIQLTFSNLIIAMAAVSIPWLLANLLLVIPRSRRTS